MVEMFDFYLKFFFFVVLYGQNYYFDLWFFVLDGIDFMVYGQVDFFFDCIGVFVGVMFQVVKVLFGNICQLVENGFDGYFFVFCNVRCVYIRFVYQLVLFVYGQ